MQETFVNFTSTYSNQCRRQSIQSKGA